MHHIQRKILNLLMFAPSLTYARARPKGVESNHFAYHLNQLIKAGIVTKTAEGQYMLTAEGMGLADRMSHADMAVRKQPHIVTTICVTNGEGQVLLFRHAFQPYLDLLGFPQGRTHHHETVMQAASRELYEKSGLKDVALTHRGIVYVHATRQGQDVSKLLAHILSGTVQGVPDLEALVTRKGACAWYDVTALAEERCMPGVLEIKRLLDAGSDFFFEEIEATI